MHRPTESRLNVRTLALGLVPAAGILALTLLVITRRGAESAMPERASAPAALAQPVNLPKMAVPAPPPRPAPDSIIAEKVQEARVRTTYMNFRTAIATGNIQLRNTLEPVLLRDRDLALKMAREELARAKEPLDQSIARQVVEALRN